MEKDKKKTLTISSNFKKTIDTSALTTGGKKSFEVKKKKFFKEDKLSNKFTNKNINQKPQSNLKKKNFVKTIVFPYLTTQVLKSFPN